MPEACNWKELLRVARWKTRSALRENRHFSRGKHEEVPASSRARENCQRASGHSATCPGLSLDDIAPRKHGTCFGSSIRKFEAGSGTSIRNRSSYPVLAPVRPDVEGKAASGSERNLSPDEGLASSRSCGNSGGASGHYGKCPNMHLDVAAWSRWEENSKRASCHSATFPKQARGTTCFESSTRKLLSCFESVRPLPEVFNWPNWLRVELVKTRMSLLRVERVKTSSVLRVILLVSHYLPSDMRAPSQTWKISGLASSRPAF